MIKVIVTKEFTDDSLTDDQLLQMVQDDEREFFDDSTWEFVREKRDDA